MLAAEFGVGQVLWSILWFFLFLIWIVLFVNVVIDVFRSHDLSGVAKALWVVALIVLPYLGVLVYLIARGDKMHERAAGDARAQESAMQDYIRGVAGSSPAAELERLEGLRTRGVISDEEFAALKAKTLA
jgi:hypothetical protein